MKTKLFIVLSFFVLSIQANAQFTKPRNKKEDCGSGENYYQQLKVDPKFRENVARIERITQQFIKSRNNNIMNEDRTEEYVIPVVIHVVWTSANENISDAQVQSFLNLLNQNYAAGNPLTSTTPIPFQPMIGNPRIRFALAVRDQNCMPTSGIIRVQNTGNISLNPIFTATDPGATLLVNNPVKQLSPAWSSDKYLNVWICRFTGGLNGYSSSPGYPANVDGVAFRHGCCGNIGTASASTLRDQTVPTHEIGHWLNLRHIWGDNPDCLQDDGVNDTPLQGTNTQWNCPAFPASVM